jgi:hypothetical protein
LSKVNVLTMRKYAKKAALRRGWLMLWSRFSDRMSQLPEAMSTMLLEDLETAIQNRLLVMERTGRCESEPPRESDLMNLLALPDHLRKTAVVVCNLGEVTARDVALETKRARAVESSYLNQLVLMQYLRKRKRGRTAYFYFEKERVGEDL